MRAIEQETDRMTAATVLAVRFLIVRTIRNNRMKNTNEVFRMLRINIPALTETVVTLAQ